MNPEHSIISCAKRRPDRGALQLQQKKLAATTIVATSFLFELTTQLTSVAYHYE